MIKMDMLKKFFCDNKLVIVIFSIFFLLVFIQQQFLCLYHDDYGYASLSYAYNVEEVEGTEFNFMQLMEFLKGHYYNWGGRVLGFFFEIVLLSKGIWLYRFVQAIIITCIYFMIFKILKKIFAKKVISDWILAVITVTCYGFFEIMLVRSGIFWITASVLYVFPILPLLLFIYLYDEKEKSFKNSFTKILFYIFNGILIFVATFSQEQIAIATLSYVVILTVYKFIKNKKINKYDIIMTLISAIAFCILMLAPGNKIRQMHPTSISFYSKSFIERIFTGFDGILAGNFSSYTRIFAVLFFISVAITAYLNLRDKKGVKVLNKMSLISISCITIITIFKEEGYFSYISGLMSYSIYKKCVLIFFVIQLISVIYSVFTYLYNKNQLKLINILISAIMSQGCMVIAPYFALRSSIIFEVLCYIFIIYIFIESLKEIKDTKIIFYISIPLILISIINFLTISIGYYKNSIINNQNHEILLNASNSLKNGEDIKEVTLKKLPNILYSGDQPYLEGCEYIKPYMREFYNLPDDFVINYQ